MSLIFNVRGDSLDPRTSQNGNFNAIYQANTATAAVTLTTDAAALSGSVIDFAADTGFNGIVWPGFRNFSTNTAWSIMMRYKVNFNGQPTGNLHGLFFMTTFYEKRDFLFSIDTLGRFRPYIQHAITGTHFNQPTGTYNASFTSGNFYDFLVKTNGTSGSDLEFWMDGVKRDTYSWGENSTIVATNGFYPSIHCGSDVFGQRGIGDLDELIIWNENISDSLAGTFIGNSRAALYSTTALNVLSNVDPGVANVKNGTGYTILGLSYTGSLVSADPGSTNVASGVGYTIEGTSYTGSAVVLTAGSGASDTLDINNIKEQIQTILENANTTTASPVDLSANLANERVKTIGKYNPDKIPTQLSLYPLVTVWVDSKGVEHETIAKNQRTGKRKAEVDVKIMGMVFNNNHVSDDADPADEDINYLMENIELTMRAFPAISGDPIKTSFPESVEYYRDWLEEEQTHLRAGVINYKVVCYY